MWLLGLVFTERGPHRIGTTYRKAIYREYTDETFAKLKPRQPEWEHLGMLGPVLRAEVGDTIRVIFKNNATHPFSMHPHGVFYAKDSEGSGYHTVTPAPTKWASLPEKLTSTPGKFRSAPAPVRTIPAPSSGSIIPTLLNRKTATWRSWKTLRRITWAITIFSVSVSPRQFQSHHQRLPVRQSAHDDHEKR